MIPTNITLIRHIITASRNESEGMLPNEIARYKLPSHFPETLIHGMAHRLDSMLQRGHESEITANNIIQNMLSLSLDL